MKFGRRFTSFLIVFLLFSFLVSVFDFAPVHAPASAQEPSSSAHTFFNVPVNTTLIPSDNASYAYMVNQVTLQAYFMTDSKSSKAVRVQNQGYTFDMDISTSQLHWYNSSLNSIIGMVQEMNPQDTVISVANNTALYAKAWINTDLFYTVQKDTVKENLIIYNVSKPSSSIIPDYLQYVANCYFNNSLTIYANGVGYLHPTNQVFNTTGEIDFNDANNATVFYLPRPYINDSSGKQTMGFYAVTANNGILIINIRIPKTFIDSAVFPIYLDPTVTFSTPEVDCVATCPLSQNTFVIAYFNLTGSYDYLCIKVYDTNGTLITSIFPSSKLSTGQIAWQSEISICPFNSTTFAVGWYDQSSTRYRYAVYNISGTLLAGINNLTGVASDGNWISLSAFNSTTFVLAYINSSSSSKYSVSFDIFDSSLALKVGPITSIGNLGVSYQALSVSCFNSTHFVIAWFNTTSKYVSFDVFDQTGTLKTGPINPSTNAGTYSCAVEVSALNSTHFVISWSDSNLGYTRFDVYDSSGNLQTGPINVDTTNGKYGYSTRVCALNSTALVISWYADLSTDYDECYATYLSSGTVITAKTDLDESSSPTTANSLFRYQEACSQEAATGIAIYNTNWIIAYSNTTTQAVWSAFTPTGAAWDGTIPAAGDTTKPTYSSPATNTTLRGASCNFTVTLQDETALGNYTFSTNNTASGAWQNDSAVVITGTIYYAGTMKVLNTTVGLVIGWEYYFNDSSGNMNNTGIQTLTTTLYAWTVQTTLTETSAATANAQRGVYVTTSTTTSSGLTSSEQIQQGISPTTTGTITLTTSVQVSYHVTTTETGSVSLNIQTSETIRITSTATGTISLVTSIKVGYSITTHETESTSLISTVANSSYVLGTGITGSLFMKVAVSVGFHITSQEDGSFTLTSTINQTMFDDTSLAPHTTGTLVLNTLTQVTCQLSTNMTENITLIQTGPANYNLVLSLVQSFGMTQTQSAGYHFTTTLPMSINLVSTSIRGMSILSVLFFCVSLESLVSLLTPIVELWSWVNPAIDWAVLISGAVGIAGAVARRVSRIRKK